MSGLIVVAAVAAVITFYWRRRRRLRQNVDAVGRTGNDVIGSDVIVRSEGVVDVSSWMHSISNSPLGDATDLTATGSSSESRDLPVVDIGSYGSVPFDDEFRQLPTTPDDDRAKSDQAIRSHLFICGYRGRKRSYIVTVTPSDIATAAYTYWAVIYQEGVTHIVSVGSGGYQPSDSEQRHFGNIGVRTIGVRRVTYFTVTTFQIRRTDDDTLTRRVLHYEFTDWPVIVQNVPTSPLPFIEFVETVRESSRRAQTGATLSPMVVQHSPTDDDSGTTAVFCIVLHLL